VAPARAPAHPGYSTATAVATMVFGDVVFAKIGSML
jgi:hypothetical protein